MRKLWKRFLHSRLGFTLLECVLAAAIMGTGSTLVMSMMSLGYAYVNRSRSLDNVASVAQEKIVVYSGAESVTQGLKDYDSESNIQYGYSDNLGVRVSYEIHMGTDRTYVIMPTTYNFVAVIAVDGQGNKVVYYEVSPQDGRIRALYSEKE